MVVTELNLNQRHDQEEVEFLSLAGQRQSLSRVSYLFWIQSSCTLLDTLLYHFIWKNKSHKVKKEVLRNTISDGGLEVGHFTLFNHALKENWLKRLIKKKQILYGTQFLILFLRTFQVLNLQCTFSLGKFPIQFHQQALLSW